MKRTLLATSLFMALAGGAIFAQYPAVTRVNVPFVFVVAGTEMPSGEYRVETYPGVARISSLDRKRVALMPIQTRFCQFSSDSRLVFERNGSTNQLTGVSGRQWSRSVTRSVTARSARW